MPEKQLQCVLVAGATGYLGKYAVQAFKRRGYHVRVLTRSEERLHESGPVTAPALAKEDFDEVFVGEISQPETLSGEIDGVGTPMGKTALRSYFEALHAGKDDVEF